MDKVNKIYGIMAEFDSAEQLLEASKKAHAEGYRNMDAYTPFPVHGLAEAVGFKESKLPLIVLIGGVVGMETFLPQQRQTKSLLLQND